MFQLRLAAEPYVLYTMCIRAVTCGGGKTRNEKMGKIHQSEPGENPPTLEDFHPAFNLRSRESGLLVDEEYTSFFCINLLYFSNQTCYSIKYLPKIFFHAKQCICSKEG